jgi:hypothetical protein
MANYSNLVGTTANSTPATSALLNKLNPQPLQPLVGALKPKPFVPTAPINQAIASHTVKPDGTVVHKYVDPIKQMASVIGATGSPSTSNSTATPTPPVTPPSQNNPNFSGVTTDNSYNATPASQNQSGGVNSNNLNVSSPASLTGGLVTQPTAGNPYIPQIASSATGNPAIAQGSADITQQYANQINPILKEATGQALGEAGTGSFQVGQGNAAATLGAAGNLISGLTAQEAQQLGAQGQKLTAQQQQTAGLSSAGSLAQPNGSFPFVFNPATGTFTTPGVSGGSTGTSGSASGVPTLSYNPAQDAKTIGDAVMNGTMTYQDGLNMLSYGSNGSSAPGQLGSYITSQGGNLAQIQARTAAQVSQVGALTTKISQIQSMAPAAISELSSLQNYAQSLGANIGSDVPIITGIQKLYSGTVGGDQKIASATAAFQAQLQTVRAAYVAIEGGDPTQAIPDNPTPSQLQAIQQQLSQDIPVKLSSLQGQLTNLKNGSTGGTTGGSPTTANPWH